VEDAFAAHQQSRWRAGVLLAVALLAGPVVGFGLGGILHAAGVAYPVWNPTIWVAMGLCWSAGLPIIARHLRMVRALGRRVSIRELRMVAVGVCLGVVGVVIAASELWGAL
jgi:hypothetical protein